MKKISSSFLALLTLIFLLQGCIKEDLADCNFNISVKFIEQGNCTLYSGSGNISIFAFNESGIFVNQFSDNNAIFGSNYTLPLSLPQGKYTLVAWAGFGASQFKSQSLIKGKTTLSELYMPSYQSSNGNKDGLHQPLFTGSVSQINAINGITPVISMNATTKPLIINASGFTVNHNYEARISYNAVQYKFENHLLSILADDHHTVTHLIAKTEDSGNYIAETSLLWPLDKYTPHLNIRDNNTGAAIFRADIKALIAQLTRVALDCEPVINIEITIDQAKPSQVGVVINGWKVMYLNNEI